MGRAPRIRIPTWNGQIPIPTLDPEDVIRIGDWHVNANDPCDVRDDDRVRAVFARTGKLRCGLRVILNDVAVDSRTEPTTVRYTFTVENLDEETLYVMDPDRIGSALFRHGTNGVNFWDSVARASFWPRLAATQRAPDLSEASDDWLEQFIPKSTPDDPRWSQGWFESLQSGESMTRTVALRGYPDIPPAEYECHLYYPGARVERESRHLPGGRVWFGGRRSSGLIVAVAE
jgi:hypothetical protein